MNATVKNPPVTFAEAFCKLQSQIKPAVKDATNPAFRSKYADLGAVWEAVRGPLNDNGFGIIQAPQFEGDTMFLETILLHQSGEKMTSRYPLRPVKQDPQGFGGALTYAKRYAISAMLGVVADEDDDGNYASGQGNGHHKPTPPPPATQDQDTTDGVANWVDRQRKAITACNTLPAMYGWLAQVAGDAGTITDPDSGSPLDRLKRKSVEAYGEITRAFQAQLVTINRKEKV